MSRLPVYGYSRLFMGTAVSVGAGNTLVSVRPPIGEIWKCHGLWGYHTSAVALVLAWVWTDDTASGQALFATSAAVAANTVLSFGAVTPADTNPDYVSKPFWITRNSYPSLIFVASAVDENGYVRGIMEEFYGAVVA